MLFSDLYGLVSHLEGAHLIICSFLVEAGIWYRSDFIDMEAQNLNKNLPLSHVMSKIPSSTSKSIQKRNPQGNVQMKSEK